MFSSATEALVSMERHAESHNLRGCTQEVFRGHPKDFWLHMMSEHGATIACDTVFQREVWRLDCWEYVQKLELCDEKWIARTIPKFDEDRECLA